MLAIVGQPLDHFLLSLEIFCNWFVLRIIWWKFTQLKYSHTKLINTIQFKIIENWPTLAEKNRYWFTKKNSSKGKLKIKIEFLYSSGHPLLEFLELYKNPRVLWNTKLHYIVRHHLDQLKMVEMVSQWPFKMKFQLTRRYQLVPSSNLGPQLTMSQVGIKEEFALTWSGA